MTSGKATTESRYADLFLKLINTGALTANEWFALRSELIAASEAI